MTTNEPHLLNHFQMKALHMEAQFMVGICSSFPIELKANALINAASKFLSGQILQVRYIFFALWYAFLQDFDIIILACHSIASYFFYSYR